MAASESYWPTLAKPCGVVLVLPRGGSCSILPYGLPDVNYWVGYKKGYLKSGKVFR